MNTEKRLFSQALREAMDVRRRTNRDILQPLCVFDVASELGVEVRFASLPSLEGMYSAGASPTIIIGAERPAGRRAYTCAHELGHHVFGHGTRVDLLQDAEGTREFIEEELLAQAFAGFLLMPKLAVMQAFTRRGLQPQNAGHHEFFRIAQLFGVGYSTLVHHLRAIGIIVSAKAEGLLRVTPSQIRREMLPGVRVDALLTVDTAWTGRAVDTEVGEILLTAPHVNVEGENLSQIVHPSERLFQATKPGRCRLVDARSDWAAFVRVSRRNYEGRSAWRHLPEEDDVCN
jgi:Zn-dependent peptidase ImmA (M78 family)